jgi:hypothetical protein
VDVLSLFRKLRTLEMSVNAGAVRLVENPLSQWVDVDGNCSFVDGASVGGISVEVEQADIDPVVVRRMFQPSYHQSRSLNIPCM